MSLSGFPHPRCRGPPRYFERTYASGVVSGPAAIAGRCHTVVDEAIANKATAVFLELF